MTALIVRHDAPDAMGKSNPTDGDSRNAASAGIEPSNTHGKTSTYRSFRELPRLTYVCGGVIVLFGLANLILMLLEVEWNGLLWLFFYSIPANTAISVFPHEPVIVYCGQYFQAIFVALVAAAGNLAAGWVDYHFFTPVLQLKFSEGYKKTKAYGKTLYWFNRAPFWVVVFFALTPLPFYVVKFFVFSSGYSMPRYMAAILVGRLPRFYLLALAGYFLKIPSWLMVVFFCGIFVVYIFWLVRSWVQARSANRVSK